jgi:hypothetical protein
MGGWCDFRHRCHDHLKEDRTIVVERLCKKGQEMPTTPYDSDPRFAQWVAARRPEKVS